jgi:hypothetical protein
MHLMLPVWDYRTIIVWIIVWAVNYYTNIIAVAMVEHMELLVVKDLLVVLVDSTVTPLVVLVLVLVLVLVVALVVALVELNLAVLLKLELKLVLEKLTLLFLSYKSMNIFIHICLMLVLF